MPKAAYHHGDLANALVAEAMRRVDIGGAEAVSLRELASQLGVSRAAPYRHFADREALLAAVAAKGFETLIASYEAALQSPGDGLAKLRALNAAFFEFATRRPGLYQLMFASEFLRGDRPPATLAPLASYAYRLLWQAVRGAYPDESEAQVKARTVIMVSTAHGFLDLERAGRFKPFMYEPLSRSDLVDAVMRAAIGEGVSPDRGAHVPT